MLQVGRVGEIKGGGRTVRSLLRPESDTRGRNTSTRFLRESVCRLNTSVLSEVNTQRGVRGVSVRVRQTVENGLCQQST